MSNSAKVRIGPLDDVELLDKVERMMAYGLQKVEGFPSNLRHSLVDKMRSVMWEMPMHVVRVAMLEHKMNALRDLDICHKQLVVLVRFAHGQKHLSDKAYGEWATKNDEIGRMIGGWMKSERNKKKKG